MLGGSISETREEHSPNVQFPRDVTLVGSVTLVRDEHP